MKIKIFDIDFPVFFTLIIFTIIILLVSFGNWQLRRLNQKEQLIESISYSIKNDPIKITYLSELQNIHTDLNSTPISESGSNLKLFSKIELEGTFFDDVIFLYGKRSASPEKDGYYVLSPFQVKSDYSGSDSGLEFTMLVMRGWIPQSVKTKIDNGYISLNDHIKDKAETIEAIIMPPEKKQFFAPANDLGKNIWFHILPQDAVSQYGVNLTDFYLRQINTTHLPEGMKALDVSKLTHMRNDHLEYAITWYLLAASVFICFVIYCRKSSKYTTTIG